MDATDRKHVNTSCSDTIKCRLDAGKSPILRSQSPCTDISVRRSQRVAVFVWIYPYESLTGLQISIFFLGLLLSLSLPNLQHHCIPHFHVTPDRTFPLSPHLLFSAVLTRSVFLSRKYHPSTCPSIFEAHPALAASIL